MQINLSEETGEHILIVALLGRLTKWPMNGESGLNAFQLYERLHNNLTYSEQHQAFIMGKQLEFSVVK